MNEQLKKYNKIAEEETYFCFWKKYEDNATTYKTYDLLDQITQFSLKVLCSEIHGNVYYYESSDINECLIKASKSNKKYVLIATPGFMCKSFLIKYLIKLAEENQDTSLFCHIMDESANSRKHLKKQWYGIHPQIFVINLEIYKKLGSPNFTSSNNEIKLIKPERSVENVHDDYTPLYLKPSKEHENINKNLKLPFGWYYINKSLEHGYKVLNFDNFIRKNKDYFYLEDIDSGFKTFNPDRKKELISKIKKHKFKMDIGFSNKIYIMNTEPYPHQMNLSDTKNPFKMYDSFDNYVFLSSGFASNFFLNQFNYNGKQKVIFYDVSGIGLSFKRILNLKWNPSESLYQFVKSQGLEKNDPEDYIIDCTSDNLKDIDSEWLEELDRWSGGIKEFKDHWKIFREQNHDYWFWDILNNPSSNYCDIINNLPGKTFMWVSNVYSNEKALYDKQNYTNINKQIKTLLKNLSTNTVVYGYLPDVNEETDIQIFKSFGRKLLHGQKKIETFVRENKNIPKENFCVLPFMHMTSSVAGWYRVCCSSSHNLKNMSQKDTSIEEAFHSDEMNDIRNQFMKGERPAACNNCWKKEDKNIESMRISVNSKFKDIIPQLDYKKPTIKYLDIKYDNKCNLACRMCSFGSSDQHQKEMIIAVEDNERLPNHMDYALYPKDSNYKRRMLKRLNKKNDKPFLEEDVIKSLPNLVMLKVTGGEPTVNHKFLNAIDYAIEHDYAKNIKLDITTNGTKFNKIFLEKISKFKQIRFRISVDGTGKVYDYIRYPFTWNMFDKSINFMFDYFKKKNILHDKVSVGFSCIAQPYNIFDLGNLYNWGYNLFKYYNIPIKGMIDINVDFQMIPNQSELNIEFMNREILKEALDQFKLQTKNIEKIEPRFEYFKNFVNNLSDNTNILDFKKYQLRKNTLFYDKIRSQSYKECLHKEIVQYINNAPPAPWEKKNNGFCILPWIHLSTRTDGTMQLCCTANSGSTKDKPKIGCNRKQDGSLVNLKEDNWTEYWNTEYMKNIRSEMLKGNKPIECSKCYNEEEVGYNSKRSWENEKWMKKIDYDTVVWDTTNEGHTPIDIHYADLKLGNKCNLACSTCNPDDSSLWIKDWNKLDKSDMTDTLRNMLGDFKKGNFNWYNNKITWEELYKQDNLRTVYMLGGEPTIIHEFKSFIDKAKNINLRFNTNGQVIDDELFNIYKKLDSVEIALSIDGIEKRHEWLRYPSNLDTTIQNLKSYNQLTKTNNNIKTNIDTTVSIFNVLHIPELIKWKMNNIDLKDINQYPTHGGMIGIHFLYNPKFLSIKCLPENYKELVSEKYEELYEWLKTNHPYYDKIIDKPNGIKKLKSIVNFMWSENKSNLLPQTFEYVRRLEEIRQLNFSIIFPELKDLYNEYR